MKRRTTSLTAALLASFTLLAIGYGVGWREGTAEGRKTVLVKAWSHGFATGTLRVFRGWAHGGDVEWYLDKETDLPRWKFRDHSKPDRHSDEAPDSTKL